MIPAIVAALGRMAPQLLGTGGRATAMHGVEGAGALYKGGGAGGLGADVFGGSVTGSVVGQGINSIISKIGETFHDITHPLQTFQKGMDNLKQTFTAIPATILKAKETIVGIGAAWTEALAAPIKTVKELGDVVGQFTRLSNPAAMKMFEYRVENTFATIGRILEPIMQALTRAAEKVGDTFAKLRGAFAPAMRGIEELIDLVMTRFGDIAEWAAPGIQHLSTMFYSLVQVIKTIQEPITFLIRKFNELRRSVFEFLGIPTGFDRDARSDIAIREPRYSNTEAIQREMAKNSLMASLGPPKERKTTESLLETVVRAIEALPAKFVELLRSAPLSVIVVGKEELQEAGGSGIFGIGGLIGAEISRQREAETSELARRRRIQNQE